MQRFISMEIAARCFDLPYSQECFVDCYGAFGEQVQGECGTVDNCHPDSLGFLRMAQCVYPVLNRLLNGEE